MSSPPPGPRRALITGGAGFIGSHLADLLLSRGDAVTVIDNLSTGRRTNLPDLHPRLRFIEADLEDALLALGKGEWFDEIYHLAAAVGVKLVLADPIRAIETNISETAALLHFALTRGRPGAQGDARPCPTLVASSSEVYGKSSHSPFHEDDDVTYGPTTAFRWSYACSKAVDEYLALAFHAQHAMPAVVARFFNTVGPRQIGDYGMVLPNFVRAAIAGEPLQVYGDGSQSRCFCDVRDVVEALPRLVVPPAAAGRVFNVGSDQPISIADLAGLVIETLGSGSKIIRIPYSEAYGRGFEDLQQRKPSLERIRTTIGFAPSRSLRTTILDIAAVLRQS